MPIRAKFWNVDHWVKFNLFPNTYENFIVFLDIHDISFLTQLELNFDNIPSILHGNRNSKNLNEFIANNTDDVDLILKFLYYFITVIIDIRYYYFDNQISFNIFNSENWQTMRFDILVPELTTTTTTTEELTTSTTTVSPTTTTTTEELTTTTTTEELTTTTTTEELTTTTTTTEDPTMCVKYGYLYNWFALSGVGSDSIASNGWHLPSKDEFDTLSTYISGSTNGYKLKEIGTTYWDETNTGTNEYEFSSRGAGMRYGGNGLFYELKSSNYMFSSTSVPGGEEAHYTPQITYDIFNTGINQSFNNYHGMNARLIKDDNVLENYIGNDGKIYKAIKIDEQVWVSENLAETLYRNLNTIPTVENADDWMALTTGAKCAYENNYNYVGCGETSGTTTTTTTETIESTTTTTTTTENLTTTTTTIAPLCIGLLYNWYAVDDTRYIAPADWHVPSNAEWTTLSTFLSTNVGGKLKETGTSHWLAPNTGATNETGFGAIGAGYRDVGAFYAHNLENDIWTATSVSPTSALYKQLLNSDGDLNTWGTNKTFGMTVRLIKDDSIDPLTMIDNDGNILPTIKIDTQVWTAVNLYSLHYRNGDPITPVYLPVNPLDDTWGTYITGALCAYNDIWTNTCADEPLTTTTTTL